MQYFNKNLLSFLILIFLIILSEGCGKTEIMPLTLPKKYQGAGTCRLDSYSLKKELEYIHSIFDDPLSANEINSLWKYSTPKITNPNYSSSEPFTQNINKLFSTLTKNGYTVFSANPNSYETIFALSREPIFLEFLCIEYDGLKSISDKIPYSNINNIPDKFRDNLRLHFLSGISKNKTAVKINTSGGITLEGEDLGNFSDKITVGSNGKYTKILMTFGITKLPKTEIQTFILEWYKKLSYKHNRPELTFY